MNAGTNVRNNPLSLVDPSGLYDCSVVFKFAHGDELKDWLRDFRRTSDMCSRGSGLGCNVDGTNDGPDDRQINDGYWNRPLTPHGSDLVGIGNGYTPPVRNCGFNHDEVPPLPPGSTKEQVAERERKLMLKDAQAFISLMKGDWQATLNKANRMAEDCKCNCKEIIARFETGFQPSTPRQILETAQTLLTQNNRAESRGAFASGMFENLSPTFKKQVPLVPTPGMEIPFKCKKK